ncbi:alkylhydroperoxidase [Ectopseudomonas mendocina DLHK]|uniref:Alkylhydroperoxidase like protein, AhpD family n=1 Tax=Ectopseudomonas mendocina (strain ymp) TaxID=399739 RepID=A4XR85_ECTM1|nr:MULTISPECIES: carboxymuconolactone decarboxylase family protein [unclassified Pseudomonas]EJO91471.1 alkylhydroperoxidase [Pseudomonas mendocina DLHK]MBA4244104.1 carboxymuconolactone decarboxylase family protein [Pseudomonas sp.]UTH35571.1 carboxymuconolactone decarboxylase family protein [Pseudomonas sp. KHPS1]
MRLNWSKASPQAYKAMLGLEAVLEQSGLELPLLELVRLRASQLNGCAYCVQMHANDARRGGASEARLQTVCVWRESAHFSARERAALAWTESLTRLSSQHPSDAEYAELGEHFDDAEIANLTLAVATINAWNRFGVGFALKAE